jgi:hypothetical protein
VSGKVDVAAINAGLKHKAELLAFELVRLGERYDLKLTLGGRAGDEVVLVLSDVQNLELNPGGNGFAQMVRLEVTDMREDGLDRVHFSLEEMERETLFLHCAGISLVLPDRPTARGAVTS